MFWRMFQLTILRRKLEFSFERDPDNRWYVVLDDYPFERADLEMVFGADSLCEILAKGSDQLIINLSLEKDGNVKHRTILNMNPLQGSGYGRDYTWFDKFEYKDAWLCPVMLYVFGHYPKSIYIYV